jgi:nucleoid DNA-binding protein
VATCQRFQRKPTEKRATRRFESCRSFQQKSRIHPPPATGETTELIALAHDMYLLQKVNRLPDSLVNRLRNYGEFQGARYEVAIAAAFVKCGFEIAWINDVRAKHPEFVGRNPHTREEVAVETKSRRRPGVLHQPGTLPTPEQLSADVDRLYREALQQDPGNRPFAIFLDVNLPPNTTADAVAGWQREITGRWQANEQLALLGFTNFAWHYSGDAPGRHPEFILAVPTKSARPLASAGTLDCLRLALDTYGVCANEY